jgi:hypothetical protein
MKRALLLLLAACARSPSEAPAKPETMSADEEERAVRLCQSYMERVCACADRDATLRDTCDLAKGEPSAVRMHLEVLHGAPLASVGPGGKLDERAPARRRPELNDSERALTEASLRKVVAACVQLDAALDPGHCPRLNAPR